MKKITLFLSMLIISIASFAIDDGTYPITGAPYTGTITFDNTAETFTITITDSPTTGYIGLGFASSSDGQMNGKYAFYIAKDGDNFSLSEQTLVNYGLGTKLAAQASIVSQDFAAGNITITRSYASTNGGFSFTGDETELHFISSKGATVGAYHGNTNRFKGTISVGAVVGVNRLEDLVGLQVYTTNQSLGLKFPAAAEGTYEVEIMNSVGQTLVRKKISSATSVHTFDELSAQPAGVYFIRLNKNGGFSTLKAMKN